VQQDVEQERLRYQHQELEQLNGMMRQLAEHY
jgi:hypothetical protein